MPTCHRLWLLACPRNKPLTWNARAAQQALTEGLRLEHLSASAPVFVSSMSVYDEPDNQYAQFKRMAEMVVQAHGCRVVRLPTLLGAQKGLVYRADLGLHQAAEAAVRDGRFHLSHTRRYVLPITQVVSILLTHDWSSPELFEVHNGTLEFCQVAPEAGRRAEKGYCAPGGSPMPGHAVLECQTAWRDLVNMIQDGKVTAC